MVKRLEFYDLKTKKKFSSSTYVIKTRVVNGTTRKYAVAKSPSSKFEYWRALPKNFKK